MKYNSKIPIVLRNESSRHLMHLDIIFFQNLETEHEEGSKNEIEKKDEIVANKNRL